MFGEINLALIMVAAFIGAASPGPATLMIAGTSMNEGRRFGLALAAGVTTGSWMWSLCAAFGLGAIMLANAWAFEVMRYLGACYLLYLAYRSARSALRAQVSQTKSSSVSSLPLAYMKGLALHLTNPKAIFFFGSLFSIGVPAGSSPKELLIIILAVGLQSSVIFVGYAFLFSNPVMVTGYNKARRWCEGLFAVAFGLAGLKVLTARFN